MLAVLLRDQGDPAALIEMPEHAWRKEQAGGEPVWFYKMYGSTPNLRGTVDWSQHGNQLSYVMQTSSGITLQSRALLETDGVSIVHEVTVPASLEVAEIQAPTCIKLYPPFTDIFLERTYVHHATGLELIASESPERMSKNAEEWLPCRYIVNCGPETQVPAKLIERLDGVTRYHKSRPADLPFIATVSNPVGWVAATHGLQCPSVFTNPARTCQHADPQALSLSNGKATLRLKLYLMRGSVADVLTRVATQHRAGLV